MHAKMILTNKHYLVIFLCVWLTFASGMDGPVDLTWPIDEKTVCWPNTKPFVFTRKIAQVKPDGNWYAMNEFCTGEHVGSHFDAPYHFSKFGWKVGDVPLERLIAPGLCINLEAKTKKVQGNATLTADDIILWEQVHGYIPKWAIILVNFGWSQFYGSPGYMHNKNHELHFPGITKEAAQLFADRKVLGVGLDTASIDPGSSTDFTAHRILAENNIYALENLNIPKNFTEVGFKLYVLPMKIKEGTGAPVRVVAMADHILLFPRADKYSMAGARDWYSETWVTLCAMLILCMYTIHSFSM